MTKTASGSNGVAAAPKAAEPLVIKGTDCRLTEQVANSWTTWVPAGTTSDELLRPVTWGPVARQMNPRDRVAVFTTDMRKAWDLVVLRKFGSGVDVALLAEHSFEGLPPLADRGLMPDGWRCYQDHSLGGWVIVRPNGEQFASQKDKPELNSQLACANYLAGHAIFRAR